MSCKYADSDWIHTGHILHESNMNPVLKIVFEHGEDSVGVISNTQVWIKLKFQIRYS